MTARVRQDSESAAIEAIRKGDPFAFRSFLRRHERWVRGVLFGVLGRSEDVDDAAQQVWTHVWQRIGELRDDERWRPWLYRLARNAALDAGRKATRKRRGEENLPPAPIERDGDRPDRVLALSEHHKQVMAAVAALPAHYREPFVLRHLEDWSYQQIAEALELPVDTVETRLVRARRLLREALTAKDLM